MANDLSPQEYKVIESASGMDVYDKAQEMMNALEGLRAERDLLITAAQQASKSGRSWRDVAKVAQRAWHLLTRRAKRGDSGGYPSSSGLVSWP